MAPTGPRTGADRIENRRGPDREPAPTGFIPNRGVHQLAPTGSRTGADRITNWRRPDRELAPTGSPIGADRIENRRRPDHQLARTGLRTGAAWVRPERHRGGTVEVTLSEGHIRPACGKSDRRWVCVDILRGRWGHRQLGRTRDGASGSGSAPTSGRRGGCRRGSPARRVTARRPTAGRRGGCRRGSSRWRRHRSRRSRR